MKYDGEVFTALSDGKNTIQSNSWHDHAAMGNYKGDPFVIGGRQRCPNFTTGRNPVTDLPQNSPQELCLWLLPQTVFLW